MNFLGQTPHFLGEKKNISSNNLLHQKAKSVALFCQLMVEGSSYTQKLCSNFYNTVVPKYTLFLAKPLCFMIVQIHDSLDCPDCLDGPDCLDYLDCPDCPDCPDCHGVAVQQLCCSWVIPCQTTEKKITLFWGIFD